jgi:hypothetical protein
VYQPKKLKWTVLFLIGLIAKQGLTIRSYLKFTILGSGIKKLDNSSGKKIQ